MGVSTQNLGPIGTAVLTFIGYKQTNTHQDRQTDKQTIYTVSEAILKVKALGKSRQVIQIVAIFYSCKFLCFKIDSVNYTNSKCRDNQKSLKQKDDFLN